eukprot:UN04333
MDLVSLTNFESVSRDLNKLGETFQQNGYDVEIIFKKEGDGSPHRLKLSNTKSGNNNNNNNNNDEIINDLKSPNLFTPFVSPIAKTLHQQESSTPEQRTGLPHSQSNTSFYPYSVPLDPVQVQQEQLEEQKNLEFGIHVQIYYYHQNQIITSYPIQKVQQQQRQHHYLLQ